MFLYLVNQLVDHLPRSHRRYTEQGYNAIYMFNTFNRCEEGVSCSLTWAWIAVAAPCSPDCEAFVHCAPEQDTVADPFNCRDATMMGPELAVQNL